MTPGSRLMAPTVRNWTEGAREEARLLGALIMRRSGNEKTGPIAATYSATTTCPDACPLKGDNGCYYESGVYTRDINRRLRVPHVTSLETAEAMGRALAAMPPIPGLPLRIHVGGDAATEDAARAIADGGEAYMAHGGGQAYSYTHAWRSVARIAWGAVSILASMEDPGEAPAAFERGYAPALVVPEHPMDGRASRDEHGTLWIPCPVQTKRTPDCATCGLCMDADALHARRAGITFEAHGATAKRAADVALSALTRKVR